MSYERTIEQYKICLDMAEKVTERRLKTNSFFIGLISAIVSLLSMAISSSFFVESRTAVVFFLWIFCLLICWAWICSIDSYKKLNSAKFRIILELEKELKHACLASEWEKLKHDAKYTRLSDNEKRIPRIFAIFISLFSIAYIIF